MPKSKQYIHTIIILLLPGLIVILLFKFIQTIKINLKHRKLGAKARFYRLNSHLELQNKKVHRMYMVYNTYCKQFFFIRNLDNLKHLVFMFLHYCIDLNVQDFYNGQIIILSAFQAVLNFF